VVFLQPENCSFIDLLWSDYYWQSADSTGSAFRLRVSAGQGTSRRHPSPHISAQKKPRTFIYMFPGLSPISCAHHHPQQQSLFCRLSPMSQSSGLVHHQQPLSSSATSVFGLPFSHLAAVGVAVAGSQAVTSSASQSFSLPTASAHHLVLRNCHPDNSWLCRGRRQASVDVRHVSLLPVATASFRCTFIINRQLQVFEIILFLHFCTALICHN
jgi:hypothetical protein